MTAIDLMTAVVLETGVPLDAIKSPSRLRPVADARKYMAYLLTTETRLPLWQIAPLMNQPVSTTSWQARSAAHLITTDPVFKRTMNRIINRLELKPHDHH